MPEPSVSDRRPRLAFYAVALSPYELHLYGRIARELGLDVTMLVPRRDQTRDWLLETPEGLSVEDLSQGDRNIGSTVSLGVQAREWARSRTALRRLRELEADALIIAGYNDLGRLRLLFNSWRTGRPVYVRSDSNLLDEAGKSDVLTFIKRLFIGGVNLFADKILAVGPLGVRYWVHYGIPQRKIETVSYEPDYSLIESLSDEAARTVTENLGVDPGRRLMVFSGRLVPVKRVDLLVDAFVAIADDRPDWDLVLLGDGVLKDELRARVPDRLSDRVKWTGFLANQADVGAVYRTADLLVLPSDCEPWAVVINEAAAAGLALVTSEVVGASSALVRSGLNGETFPKGDLPGLTDSLRRVTDPAAIDGYKAGSAEVLADWRRDCDPVDRLRRVLVDSGVLPID